MTFLDATLWLPKSNAKAGLIFCHGWGGGSQYDDLLETLADNGYFALRFQQRGYGDSTGQSDLGLWVEDMTACAAVLKTVTNKIWAAGQSTGGTMSLIAAATQPASPARCRLRLFAAWSKFCATMRRRNPYWNRASARFRKKTIGLPMRSRCTRGMKKPVLLIHGTADRTVPIAHGKQLAESIGASGHIFSG